MAIQDYSGYWTGRFEGTNEGGFTIDIKQNGNEIDGVARLAEPSHGQYEYSISGVAGETLSFRLKPGSQSGGIYLGPVEVLASIDVEGRLEGRWKSTIGTEGTFSAKRFESRKLAADLPTSNSVFIVHGHDEGSKHSVARFLEQLGITPVVLQEQISRGMTVIEKFQDLASRAGFAVVLMTADDIGYPVSKEGEKKHRPRQNVVLELGYFAARLGRSKTLVLIKGDVELPSDILGLVYEPMDKNEGWKMRLARELKAAGFTVDLNRTIA